MVAIALSAVAAAQSIEKWKTPDGKLYFGDRPPAGSTKVDEYKECARPSPGEPATSPRAADAKPLREWRQGST
jgi:hypothetical protein